MFRAILRFQSRVSATAWTKPWGQKYEDFNKFTHMNVLSYCNQSNYWPLIKSHAYQFLGVKWPVQGVYEVQKHKNANPIPEM